MCDTKAKNTPPLSQMVSVRPDENKDRFADYAKSVQVQSVESIDEKPWITRNAKFLVKSADGGNVLMVAGSCLTAGIAEFLLGEENCQVEQLEKQGWQLLSEFSQEGEQAKELERLAQRRLDLVASGLTLYGDDKVYEIKGADNPVRLTHAVIQSGVMGEHDPFVCALCSNELADLLKGVEEGHTNDDGTVSWRGIFLTTVPLVFDE